VHLPFSVGSLWLLSVGTAVPLASVGVHTAVVSSHQAPCPHSASVVQPTVQAPDVEQYGADAPQGFAPVVPWFPVQASVHVPALQ
jgi:hypothetical protein